VTYRYGFEPPCTLIIREQLDSKPKTESKVPLKGLSTRILRYMGQDAFGVKGYLPGDSASVDLFDSRSESTARSFAALIERLAASCS
jgi:hypothetical protein